LTIRAGFNSDLHRVMQAQRLIVAFQAGCGDPIPLPELSAAEIQGWALTEAIAASDETPKGVLKVAGAGLLTGVVTPLLPPLIDRINGTPGDFRIALVAIPFAILVFILIRRFSPNPWWAALAAAIVTMIAFVCAVNVAIWIDGRAADAAKATRNILAGLAGGFTGATIMAVGMCLLPAGPRDVGAWLPMLSVGTIAGALLALDNALDLDLTSFLYPVWQASVAVGLATALRRTRSSLDVND
jgi:hypothetical protein